MSEPKCLASEHHRAECECGVRAQGWFAKQLERAERLEYVARQAILAGYSHRDDRHPEEWFTEELDRLQKLLGELQ